MAPFGHILRIESSESLLNRLSQTDLRSDHLTPFQTHIDQLISQGTQEITNTTAIVSMMSGSLAYKSARVGVLGIMGSGSGWLATLLRPASVGLGLCAEVVAFEGTNRALQGLGSHSMNPHLWTWEGQGGWREGLLNSFITFSTLKSAAGFSHGQNWMLQQLFASTAMVVGHQATYQLALTERPQGDLFEQFSHAFMTNLELGLSMGLAARLTPGLQALERSLHLSLSHTHSRPIFPQNTFDDLHLNPELACQASGSRFKPARIPSNILLSEADGPGGIYTRPTLDASQVPPSEILSEVRDGNLYIRNGIAIDAHNRFRVLRHLGSGGFGDAYLVQDTQIDREVVVKIPKRNSRGPYQNPQQIAYEMREQIQHEMNIGAHLDSSYAAWIIDSVPLREELIQQLFPNSQTSEPFSVPIMEYVEGKSLHDMLYELRAGVYSFGYLLEDPRARLNLFSDICEAIYSAHKRGIAHRDIKPDHIIINRDQETGRFRVRILDWGIAIHTKNYRPNLLHLRVQGTPGYIAPEISRKGMSTDYLSSDQFALGVILYQLMTYRHPYSQFRPGKPEANEPALVPIQHGREPSLINDALMNTDGGNQLVPHFREVILEEHPSFFYSIEALARRAFSFKIQERFPSVLHFREAVLMHYPHEEYQQIQQIRQAMTHLSSEIEKAWAPFHLGKQIDLEQWDQMDSGLIRFVEQRAEWRAKAESLIGDLKGLIPKLSQPALAHSMISELAWQLFVDTSPHDAHNLGRYRRLILENHVVADRESLGAMTVEALQEPISLQFNTVDFETGQSIDPAQVQLNVLPIVYETRGGRNVPFFKLGAALFSGSIDTFHSDQRLPAGGYLFEIEATGYAPMRIPIEIEYDQVRDCLRRESVLQKEIRFISESRVPEGMDLIHEGRGYLGYNFYENPGVHPVDVYSLPERRFHYPAFAVSHVPASIQDYFGFLQSELEVLNAFMRSEVSSQEIRSQAEKIRQLLPRNQEAILDPLSENPIDYFNNRNRLLYWNIQALEHEGKVEFVLQDPTTHLDPNNDPIFWNQSITAITGESALAFVRFMAQKTGLPLELIDEDLNEILVRNGRRDRFVFGDRFHPAYIVSRLSLRDPIRDSYPQRMGTHPLGDEMNRDRSLFGPIEVMGNTRKFVRTQFGEGRTIGVAGGGVRNAYGPFFNPASRTSMRNNKADNSTGSIRMILRFPRLNP